MAVISLRKLSAVAAASADAAAASSEPKAPDVDLDNWRKIAGQLYKVREAFSRIALRVSHAFCCAGQAVPRAGADSEAGLCAHQPEPVGPRGVAQGPVVDSLRCVQILTEC